MKNIEQLFNTDPLLNELNNVIQSGLNKLLSDYTTNYKLYEETHNCIMNLPSVKREIAKKSELNETYNDLPDLISISSDGDTSDHRTFKNDYSKYFRVPLHYDSEDSDQESDDTLLCMKKVANQLLKEKEETLALYQEEEKSYKEIIESRNKEIDELKDRINTLFEQNNRRYEMFYEQKELYENAIEKYNKEIDDLKKQLNSCVKQPLVCDLTSDNNDSDQEVIDEPNQEPEQLVIEIKQEKEKENIVLHIEEAETDIDEESDEEVEIPINADEESDDEEETESDNEVQIPINAAEESDDEELAEDQVAIEDEQVDEEDEELVEDEEVDEDEELVEEDEEVVEDEEVETEKSDSDEESQEVEETVEETVEDDDEEELIEIEIDGVTYCTENEDNGFIYLIDEDGTVGEATGYLKEGEPFFN
jgi:hypothetical protein